MTRAPRHMKTRLLFVLSLLVFAATLPLRAAEVTVFAAASLTDALKETAAAYEKQSGDKIVFNFGASSMLERQIEEGAPADIFFSADEAKMDALTAEDLIVKGTRKSLLSNTLVIVTSSESGLKITSPADLTDAGRRLFQSFSGETKSLGANRIQSRPGR